MLKDKMRIWPAMLAASMMIMGAFIIAVPATVQADGHFLLKSTPIGSYRVDLTINGNMGPDEFQSVPFQEIDNTASITQYTGPGGNVIIPTTMAYPWLSVGGEIVVEDPPISNIVRVSSIGPGAFEGRVDITSITIPEGVDFIDAGAFCGCTHLTSLYFLGTTLPVVSDQWLSGANINLKGYSAYASGINPHGTDYFGLTIYRLVQATPVKPPVQLTGTVVDASGQYVAGALVAAGSYGDTTTDENGHFVLLAPAGFNSITISGSGVKTTTVATYLGAGGAELGEVPVANAESSGETHTNEAVGLMVGIIVLAILLLVISMVVANKRMKE
jgi:hypothetical protein